VWLVALALGAAHDIDIDIEVHTPAAVTTSLASALAFIF
jgi:hypothetical protein